MKLKLRGLSQGEHQFSFDEPVKDYGLDAELFRGNIDSDVRVDVQGKNYYIRIASTVSAAFECDRCLDSFVRDISVEIRIIYTEDRSLGPDDDTEGLHFLAANEDVVTLDEDLRQNLMLAVPMKKVCCDDCKGLCPVCGGNLNKKSCGCVVENVDSRWDALKKLKTDDPKPGT